MVPPPELDAEAGEPALEELETLEEAPAKAEPAELEPTSEAEEAEPAETGRAQAPPRAEEEVSLEEVPEELGEEEPEAITLQEQPEAASSKRTPEAALPPEEPTQAVLPLEEPAEAALPTEEPPSPVSEPEELPPSAAAPESEAPAQKPPPQAAPGKPEPPSGETENLRKQLRDYLDTVKDRLEAGPAQKPAQQAARSPGELLDYLGKLSEYLPERQRNRFRTSNERLAMEMVKSRLAGRKGLRERIRQNHRSAVAPPPRGPLTRPHVVNTFSYLKDLSAWHPDKAVGAALRDRIDSILARIGKTG
jgi:hypothetical protein